MSRTPYSAFEENVMSEILAVESDWSKPLWERRGGCYGRLMDCADEPGVCSGNPPAIMPHGVGGDRYEGWITGTRVYAWQVAEALDRLGSVDAAAKELELSLHQARVAIEWAERHGLAHRPTF
jgi:uncharacterized protein (DUF433 family)